MKKIDLLCTKCAKKYSINEPNFRCADCGEPLEIEMFTNSKFSDRSERNILKKYSDFFPFENINPSLSLGEGTTPLIESNSLGRELNINLFLKNESLNPTWSFKDRGTYVALQHALKLGFKRIGTVSTGNMASSVASYGARADIETVILVKKGMAKEKIIQTYVYEPQIIEVDGDYGSLYYESLKLGKEKGIYFMNSDNPFRVEGSKTIAFEIVEQMNLSSPGFVIVPTSAGGNIRGIYKGFKECFLNGLIEKIPTIVCVQAKGCSPIYEAFINNKTEIERFENPHTVARAIENPFPPSGNAVLRLLKENNGLCIAVEEEDILKARIDLATEGIFVQPASAVSLAGLRLLKDKNQINENSNVVCILTGSGLKTLSNINNQGNIKQRSIKELNSLL